MEFRKRYDESDNADYGMITAIDFSHDPGLTIQEPAEDADINVLMARMRVGPTGTLPYFTDARALYGDFSEIPTDPVEIAEMMRTAREEFMKIPAPVRQRFSTPEELFQFMNDDNNYDEAVKLGLLNKKPDKSPLDKLVDKMDTWVSSSTSSDKEPLVPTSNSSKEK